MVWSSDTLPTGSQNAVSAGKPCFLSQNFARDGQWKWVSTGSSPNAASDWTHPDFPVDNLSNGIPYTGTKHFGSGGTTYYLYGDLQSNTVEFDAIFLKMLYSAGDSNVTIEASENVDMTSPVEIANFPTMGATDRKVKIDLGSGFVSHTGLRYWLITIENNASSTAIPIVGEFVIAQRRQLSREFQIPWDDQPDAVDVRDWISRGRAFYRHVRAECFRDFQGEYILGEGKNPYGLSDDVTIFDVYSDCGQGQDPVVFILNPDTFDDTVSHEAYFGFIGPGLSRPKEGGPFERSWDFEFAEASPFYCNENTSTAEIILANTVSLDLNTTSSGTLSKVSPTSMPTTSMSGIMWIKNRTAPDGDTRQYMSYESTSGGQKISWRFQVRNGPTHGTRLAFWTYSGTSFKRTVAYAGITTFLPFDTWGMVGFSYDGTVTESDRVKIYVDGVEVQFNGDVQAYSSLQLPSDTPELYIGEPSVGTAAYRVNYAALFDSTLTTANMLSLYNSGVPKDLSTRSDVIMWTRGGNAESFPSTWDAFTETITFTDFSGTGNGMTANANGATLFTEADIVSDTP